MPSSHLAIFLLSSLALSALGQTFENFPAVGGSRPAAPLRSSSPQSRPPGNRVNVQNSRVNEVEPLQEERRVNRNKGRSRTRAKPVAPSRSSVPLRSAAPSRGEAPVRAAAPVTQPERKRVNAPRRRPQQVVQPEVEKENKIRVRVRPTTTPVPTTRKFVPAFINEPAGQSLDQAFGNVFNSEQTRPAPRQTTVPTTTRPTPRPTRPTVRPTPPTLPTRPPTTTQFTQPAAPAQPTSTPFVFLPADSFQAQAQPQKSFTAFPAAPRQEVFEQPAQQAFQAQPAQQAFQPQPAQQAFQTFQAQPQQEQFQPRQSFQPQQPARAPLPPQRRPKVVDQMFDSSSLFIQDLSAPENTGDGVYFSYSAIL